MKYINGASHLKLPFFPSVLDIKQAFFSNLKCILIITIYIYICCFVESMQLANFKVTLSRFIWIIKNTLYLFKATIHNHTLGKLRISKCWDKIHLNGIHLERKDVNTTFKLPSECRLCPLPRWGKTAETSRRYCFKASKDIKAMVSYKKLQLTRSFCSDIHVWRSFSSLVLEGGYPV